MSDYAIKKGYKARLKNEYYDDFTGDTVWQPDVYTAAIELARKSGSKTIIDIGSGNGLKLIPYKKEFNFIFVDFGPNLKVIEKNVGKKGNQFIDQDFEKGFPVFKKDLLKESVVICSDVIEHMRNPDILTESLVKLSMDAPFIVVSTPDRLRTRGVEHFGPPQNQTHVREWSMEELDSYFRSKGMKNHLSGITRTNDYEQFRRTIIIVGGTFISNLKKPLKEKVFLSADYGPNNEIARDHYWANQIIIEPNNTNAVIGLKKDEWLVGPNISITAGAVISDAIKNGYTTISAQVIEVNPNDSYSWPKAGLIRHGHGLIGILRPPKKLTIKRSSIEKKYPLSLTIFKNSQRKFGYKVSLNDPRIIDTGHLIDDYLLESLVGWHITKR